MEQLLLPQELDFLFPFFVFSYGLLIIVVTELPQVRKLELQRLKPLKDQIYGHQKLAWISFFVGGFWSVQNLLLL